MSDQSLDGTQFSSGPPRSAWGCALFALVVVLAIVAVSALCGGGCCDVVRRAEGTCGPARRSPAPEKAS